MPARGARRGGFTLLELLIVVAISAITILAAVAVFAAMLNQKRTSERTLEVYTSLAMAQGVMEYDITNAGWRFPAAAVSVRVINAVDTSTVFYVNGLGTGPTFTTATNCGGNTAWGLVPGSDVLELAEGYAEESNGVVQSASASDFMLKSGTAPFTTVTSGQPVVLFANPQGDIWLGRVTSGAAAGGSHIVFALLNADFTTAGSSPYAAAAPTSGATVYRLGHRTRYVVCQDTTAGTTVRPVLFRQVSGDDGDLSAGGWQRLQDGVADLQVALRVADPSGTHLSGGTECVAAGAAQYCYCNLGSICTGTDAAAVANTPAGGFFQHAVLAHTDRGSADQWVKGLRVGLTGVSTRTVAVPGQGGSPIYLRPALFDNAAATGTGDGNLYLTQQRSLVLRNLTQVIP